MGGQVFCSKFEMPYITLTILRVEPGYAILFNFEANKWGKFRIKNQPWVQGLRCDQAAFLCEFCIKFTCLRNSTVSLELKTKYRSLHRNICLHFRSTVSPGRLDVPSPLLGLRLQTRFFHCFDNRPRIMPPKRLKKTYAQRKLSSLSSLC